MNKIIKKLKNKGSGISELIIKIAITIFMSPVLFPSTAHAVDPLGEVINEFLEVLQGPLRTGAGLGLLFGLFQLVMAFKEDSPQAKSSAIKFLVGAGALSLFAENFIDWIGI